MKCQILFSGINEKNITNLSSADLAQRVVKVNKSSSTANKPRWRYLAAQQEYSR